MYMKGESDMNMNLKTVLELIFFCLFSRIVLMNRSTTYFTPIPKNKSKHFLKKMFDISLGFTLQN